MDNEEGRDNFFSYVHQEGNDKSFDKTLWKIISNRITNTYERSFGETKIRKSLSGFLAQIGFEDFIFSFESSIRPDNTPNMSDNFFTLRRKRRRITMHWKRKPCFSERCELKEVRKAQKRQEKILKQRSKLSAQK